MSEPMALWEVKLRMDAALQNVLAALKDGKANPVFIGIEHLPSLLTHWTDQRPVIVIEKSAAYAELFVKEVAPVPGSLPTHVKIITGQIGIKSPFTFRNFDFSFHRQEIVSLILQIMPLPDTWFENSRLYEVPLEPGEMPFSYYLRRALVALAESKKFHLHHCRQYEEIRASKKNASRPLFLIADPEEINDLGRHFDALEIKPDSLVFNMMTPAGGSSKNGWIFEEEDLTDKPLHFAETASLLPEIFSLKARQLLDLLEKEKPAHALMRNRSPFCAFEDILFTEELLRRSGLETCFFFIDSFFQYGDMLEGGYSFGALTELWPSGQAHFFTADPLSNAPAIPARFSTYEAPYRNITINHQIVPPLAKPEELSGEIVAIHLARDYATFFQEVNEMVEMVQAFSPLDFGTSTYNSLFLLRQHQHLLSGPLNSSFIRNLIQTMHWYFYAQVRIRRVMDTVSRFGNLKFAIYGEGWQRFLPAANCRGHAKPEETPDIQRRALCTIDFSITPSPHVPHFSAIHCLANGGLPVVSAPFLQPDQSNDDQFSVPSIPTFRNVEELGRILENLRHHPENRATLIKKAQEEMLYALGRQKKWASSVEDLQKRGKLKRADPFIGPLSLDPVTDQFILDAFTGYLFSFGGYLAAALEVWKSTVTSCNHYHLPLLIRATRTALEINDGTQARFFLSLAKASNPEEALLIEQLARQIRG